MSTQCSLASTSLADPSIGRNKTVRSTRLLERRSKQRKVPKSKVIDDETYLARKDDAQEKLRAEKKKNEEHDQDDPLRLFLWGPETKQLLTLEQESQLISQIQDLLRLEEVKTNLQSQFGREPTMAEWAEGAGLNCRLLQSQLHSGIRSREKLIQANLRMVVHVAKSYQGRGLSLQDLLQNSCYLQEKVFILLGKVIEAKKLYIQEGNLHPTKEELARRVRVTVEKIDKLLFSARIPISMQQTVWADQNTTFQVLCAS
ncbi:RNA polymerase sigma factor sigF, chloroplastic [Glycine soja]